MQAAFMVTYCLLYKSVCADKVIIMCRGRSWADVSSYSSLMYSVKSLCALHDSGLSLLQSPRQPKELSYFVGRDLQRN